MNVCVLTSCCSSSGENMVPEQTIQIQEDDEKRNEWTWGRPPVPPLPRTGTSAWPDNLPQCTLGDLWTILDTGTPDTSRTHTGRCEAAGNLKQARTTQRIRLVGVKHTAHELKKYDLSNIFSRKTAQTKSKQKGHNFTPNLFILNIH